MNYCVQSDADGKRAMRCSSINSQSDLASPISTCILSRKVNSTVSGMEPGAVEEIFQHSLIATACHTSLGKWARTGARHWRTLWPLSPTPLSLTPLSPDSHSTMFAPDSTFCRFRCLGKVIRRQGMHKIRKWATERVGGCQ